MYLTLSTPKNTSQENADSSQTCENEFKTNKISSWSPSWLQAEKGEEKMNREINEFLNPVSSVPDQTHPIQPILLWYLQFSGQI